LQTVAAATFMKSKAYGLVANWRAFPLRKRQPLGKALHCLSPAREEVR
jgi:hypothetical protein